MCARHTSTPQDWVTTQGNFAAASRIASTLHRPAHGVRSKASQASELVSHDGFEPKPSGGHRTIGLTVAPLRVLSRLRRPTGAKVGERPRCGLLLGLPGQGVRPCRLRSWWRQRRGGSSRRPPCCWTWQSSTNMSGTTTSGKKVGKPVFQRDFWLVGALHAKAGAFSRPTNAPPFHSGPLGPFFQVAVGPQLLPNSCWQLSW